MNVDQLITMLEELFAKAPALPANVREVLVKIAPWFALIFGVLGILGSLMATMALLGASAMVASVATVSMGAAGYYSILAIVALVVGLISSALMLLAYPGLKANKMAGWRYLFFSEVVSLVSAVVSLNLLGLVIGGVIGFYLLFQVKSYYK